MKDGRVSLQIAYKEDLRLEIKTTIRYTTGNWTRLEMVRHYDRKKKIEKGNLNKCIHNVCKLNEEIENSLRKNFISVALKVGGEMKEGVPAPSSPAQSDIPDLSSPHYLVGGSPPGFESSLPLPGSFLGCISDLQVNQEAYNLMKGQYWNVQKSCMNKVLEKVFVGIDEIK